MFFLAVEGYNDKKKESYSYPALHFVTSRTLTEAEAKKKENIGKSGIDYFTVKFFPRELSGIIQALEEIQSRNDHLPW